jgi:PST family polysaccharide transporter
MDITTQVESELRAQAGVTPHGEDERLGRRMLGAIAWSGAGTWSAQLVTWFSTVIVARLLTPSDYGLVGMATIFIGLAMLVSEFGLGAAIVSFRGLTGEEVAQLNTLSVFFGLLWVLLSCVAAYPLSVFFHANQLPVVIVVMSGSFLITAFKVVPDALLLRDLQFKTLARIDVSRAVVTSLMTILIAWRGHGYWALVLGNIFGVSTATVMAVRRRPYRFAWPNFRLLEPSLRFSWHLITSRVSWYSYSNSDFVIAGRVLGRAALGSYTFAWTMASLPIEKVSSLVVRVVLPFFSAMQTNKEELRRYLLALTEGLLLITLPISLGLSLVAPRMIYAIFGPRWEGAAAPLEMLALYGSFRSISTILPPLLNVRGHSRFVMWNTVAAAAYFPIAFYVGSHWGTTGIALVWLLLYPCVALPLYWCAFRDIELSFGSYLKALQPAIHAASIMTLAVLLARWAALRHIFYRAELFLEVTVGAVVYIAVLLTFYRDRLLRFYRIVRPRAGANVSRREEQRSLVVNGHSSAIGNQGNAD